LKLQPDLKDQLSELATEVAERSGLSVYDLEFVGTGGNRSLRVFLDGEKGVSIDDCADFSRGFSIVLDANDLIPGGKYELEVSSPGLERKLTQKWHFERALGKKVQIKTSEPVPIPEELNTKKQIKVKTLVGELLEVESSCVIINKDNAKWTVELEMIDRAKIVFEQPEKNKKRSKGK